MTNQVAEARRRRRRLTCVGVGVEAQGTLEPIAADPLGQQLLGQYRRGGLAGLVAIIRQHDPLDPMGAKGGPMRVGEAPYPVAARHVVKARDPKGEGVE